MGDESGDLSLNDASVNPEGYGIQGDFVPVATFESHDDSQSGTTAGTSVGGSTMLEGEWEEEKLGESIGGGEEGEGEGEDYRYDYNYKAIEEVQEEEEAKKEEEEEEEEEKEKAKKEIHFDKVEEEKPARPSKPTVYRQRQSVRSRSIFYPDESRFLEEKKKRISGDFTVRASVVSITGAGSIPTYSAGESSVEAEEEEELPPIDREEYYAVFREFEPQRCFQRMKNNLLQRKMADFFRKRKMEHVLKETDSQVDSQQKYDRKLDSMADLKDFDERERANITWELDDLRTQRDDLLSMINTHFDAMQQREKDIGTGLINTKTGKEIPEKLVERFIHRQRDKANVVASLRLFYIKLRNRVAEKKVALEALDTIGENLYLMDYEQLKIENQSHNDKIEERDYDLAKMRTKCKTAMQCLAHVREKSAAVLLDIIQLKERFDIVNADFNECRERVNYYKHERDHLRFAILKLKDEAGLLCKPQLCRDRDDTLDELKMHTEEYETLRKENKELRDGLKAIKHNIASSGLKAKSKIQVCEKKSGPRIYRGRPTLIYPELPESDWGSAPELHRF